jgi:hypothetical protein
VTAEPLMAADVGHAFSGGTLSEREKTERVGSVAAPAASSPELGPLSRSESVSPTARGGRPREHDWTRMQELRAQGLSYYRIARILHVNHTTVMYACDPAFRARRKARRPTGKRVYTRNET